MWGLRFRVWGLGVFVLRKYRGLKMDYRAIKTILVCRVRPKTLWGLWNFSIGISEDDLGSTL